MANKDVPRDLVPPKGSFFLFGARGSGKSTWLEHTFPGALRIDLLDEGLYQELLIRPPLLGEMLGAQRSGGWIVIDEIQRLPNLLNEVHRAIEKKRLKFALSGSSARKLKRAGVNLLGGRAERLTMFPFMPSELGDRFDLEEALAVGTLPIVMASEAPHKTLMAYAQMYLREEIQTEALVRNLPAFARFLGIAALFHGQTLNVSTLAREAGVQRTTVNDYLEILEDTMMAFRLPAFEAKLRVRERKHSKLYWIDPGVVRAVKKQLGALTQEERGPLFEGLMATMLRHRLEREHPQAELAYWASADLEVDFVVRKGKSIFAFEAKTSTRLRNEDLAGLRSIGALAGVRRRVLVYGGTRALRTEDEIDVLPFDHWARELASGELWSR